MRTLLIYLTLLSALVAGEVHVITPAGDFAVANVESITTGEALENPEPSLSQEGQVETYTFKNVKEGKYRVSYMAVDNPMGVNQTLMETLVTVDKTSTTTLFFFRPRERQQLMLPKDIEEFLIKHRDNLMELTAVYDGGKASFVQARGGAWAIGYLRNDCDYSLKVWNHSYQDFPRDPKDRSVIYEKTFRTVAREMDPFSPGGIPHGPDNKSEQGGAGQPATRSKSDPEGGDKPQPEAEGRSR